MHLNGGTELIYLIAAVLINFGAAVLVATYGEKWRWEGKVTVVLASCLFLAGVLVEAWTTIH